MPSNIHFSTLKTKLYGFPEIRVLHSSLDGHSTFLNMPLSEIYLPKIPTKILKDLNRLSFIFSTALYIHTPRVTQKSLRARCKGASFHWLGISFPKSDAQPLVCKRVLFGGLFRRSLSTGANIYSSFNRFITVAVDGSIKGPVDCIHIRWAFDSTVNGSNHSSSALWPCWHLWLLWG